MKKALTIVNQVAFVHSVSKRPIDNLVQAIGGTGVYKSKVSRQCEVSAASIEAVIVRPKSV